jgi:DNA-binding beta-propeller fold protein YncE
MRRTRWKTVLVVGGVLALTAPLLAARRSESSRFLHYGAPAGKLPATRHVTIDGVDAAVLPSGRLVTPAGVEVSVEAPKPFGLALSPNGQVLASINSGASRFSVTLLSALNTLSPSVKQVPIDATFMGIVFSQDGARFYASGGENGNVWVGETQSGKLIGSVNLNGPTHPLDRPLDPASTPTKRFKGTFPGRMALAPNGQYLYVVDQGAFQVQVLDTRLIQTGLDLTGKISEPDNFAAVVARIPVGRYPFDAVLSLDGKRLYVVNVGTFQFRHLAPPSPTGNPNSDFPLCFPGAGYPDETGSDRTIHIAPVDPRALPDSLRDPGGIRCGYVTAGRNFTVPGLGSPNAPESNSLWMFDVSNPLAASRIAVLKTGPRIAERVDEVLMGDPDEDDGSGAYAGPHPNAIAVGPEAVYVTNGNDDSVAVLHAGESDVDRIPLSPLKGPDRELRGVQPVALALSPDRKTLYVAEAGLNSVAVIRGGRVLGHIPTGWWPAALAVSSDGKTLYVANARGRGAGPNNPFPPDNLDSPKHSILGSVSIIPVPDGAQLQRYTERVLKNNGFLRKVGDEELGQLQRKIDWLRHQVKHVVFINKENATHDLLIGDITKTLSGQPVDGEPSYSLGEAASPNHHALALRYAFSDNFFLEPSVSSDGHRWLENTYTSEFEETHWPASYGGRRRDSGDDPTSYGPYPGRLGFTDANSSADPNDYNQRGGVPLHLARHGLSFVNFGNGYEFAEVDEDFGTEPTGIRHHVNVPMEKVVRDRSDHLFPEFNTHIPDAPLPEDPTRFSRFGRFRQIFESHYVDRARGECKLPAYVDLYYPNDHGGGANDIYPDGSHPWSFERFVQDNDSALGLTVDLISKSPCWKETVFFVVEDDAQNGFDHVDGHRSLFLAIGPTIKPGYLLKTHASLSSIFKTVDLLLGVPPLNLYDAAASDLLELFVDPQSHGQEGPFDRREFREDARKADLWKKSTEGVDFRSRDSDEVNLRDAIRASTGLGRK